MAKLTPSNRPKGHALRNVPDRYFSPLREHDGSLSRSCTTAIFWPAFFFTRQRRHSYDADKNGQAFHCKTLFLRRFATVGLLGCGAIWHSIQPVLQVKIKETDEKRKSVVNYCVAVIKRFNLLSMAVLNGSSGVCSNFQDSQGHTLSGYGSRPSQPYKHPPVSAARLGKTVMHGSAIWRGEADSPTPNC